MNIILGQLILILAIHFILRAYKEWWVGTPDLPFLPELTPEMALLTEEEKLLPEEERGRILQEKREKRAKERPRFPDWIKWLFAIPIVKTDYDEAGRKVYPRQFSNDILFSLVLCVIVNAILMYALRLLFNVSYPEWSWLLDKGDCIRVLIYGVIAWACFFEFVPIEVLAERELIGVSYFRKCFMFHPRIPPWPFAHFSPLTKVTRFLTEVITMFTSKDPTSDEAAISQIRQGRTDGKVGSAEEGSDKQLVQISMIVQTDVDRPFTVSRYFKKFFRRRMWEKNRFASERGKGSLISEVAKTVARFCDPPLQRHRVRELQDNVEAVNTDLKDHLTPILHNIGIILTNVNLSDTLDITPNGFVTQRSLGTQAKNASERRQDVANAGKTASLVEIEAQNEIVRRKRKQLRSELVNEKVIAETLIQRLKARLELLATRDAQAAALVQSLVALSPEEMVNFLRGLAVVAEGLGFKVNGSLIVGGGDFGKLIDLTPLGSMVAAGVEVLRAQGKFVPASTSLPPAVVPPAAP